MIDLLKKILVDRAFPEVLTPSIKVNGAKPLTSKQQPSFLALSAKKIRLPTQMIEDGEDVNRRDHVGRTPLHAAIISNSAECANILIDAGARMTARLVGGRTSFHLAAQTGQTSLVKKMLARSAYNETKSVEEKPNSKEAEENLEVTEHVRMSSEDTGPPSPTTASLPRQPRRLS